MPRPEVDQLPDEKEPELISNYCLDTASQATEEEKQQLSLVVLRHQVIEQPYAPA